MFVMLLEYVSLLQATQASVSMRPLSTKTWNFSTEPGSSGKKRTRKLQGRTLTVCVLVLPVAVKYPLRLLFAGAKQAVRHTAVKGSGNGHGRWTPGKGQQKGA